MRDLHAVRERRMPAPLLPIRQASFAKIRAAAIQTAMQLPRQGRGLFLRKSLPAQDLRQQSFQRGGAGRHSPGSNSF